MLQRAISVVMVCLPEISSGKTNDQIACLSIVSYVNAKAGSVEAGNVPASTWL